MENGTEKASYKCGREMRDEQNPDFLVVNDEIDKAIDDYFATKPNRRKIKTGFALTMLRISRIIQVYKIEWPETERRTKWMNVINVARS